jgi:hypothetical protein
MRVLSSAPQTQNYACMYNEVLAQDDAELAMDDVCMQTQNEGVNVCEDPQTQNQNQTQTPTQTSNNTTPVSANATATLDAHFSYFRRERSISLGMNPNSEKPGNPGLSPRPDKLVSLGLSPRSGVPGKGKGVIGEKKEVDMCVAVTGVVTSGWWLNSIKAPLAVVSTAGLEKVCVYVCMCMCMCMCVGSSCIASRRLLLLFRLRGLRRCV